MMSGSLSAVSRRAAMGLGLAAVLGAATLSAQQTTPPPAGQQAAAPAAPAQEDPFKFKTDSAAILWFIKADKTADFETAMGTIKAKMIASDKPDIKAAGEGMKMFKVDGPPSADTGYTYITVIENVSKGTSYSPTWVLYESGLFERTDAQAVYDKLKDTYVRIVPWSMAKVG